MDDDDYFNEFLAVFLPLVGKSYVFEDKDKIEIVQIKRRDEGPYVTYHVTQGPGIPRKLVMRIDEFSHTYGHLFNKHDEN